MDILEVLTKDGNKPIKVAQNATGCFYQYIKEGQYILVKLPSTLLEMNTHYKELFQSDKQATEGFTSPLILRTIANQSNEKGYWNELDSMGVVSMGDTLKSNPAMVTKEGWVNDFITDLLDALEYLHQKNLFAIDLSPLNVMLSKRGQRLLLAPPCSPYLQLKDTIWNTENPYLAPEVWHEGEEVGVTADIYSVGKLLEFLFQYGNTPLFYGRIIKKCISANPKKRYQSIDKLRKAMNRTKPKKKALTVLSSILATAAIVGLFAWNLNTEEVERVYVEAQTNTPAAPTDTSSMAVDVERYIEDTTYLNVDTAYSLSPEMREKQREGMQKAQIVFKTEFEKQAIPILRNLYDTKTMNMKEQNFRKETQKTIIKLQNIQEKLCSQYKIEPTTAARIASESIEDITNKLKNN